MQDWRWDSLAGWKVGKKVNILSVKSCAYLTRSWRALFGRTTHRKSQSINPLAARMYEHHIYLTIAIAYPFTKYLPLRVVLLRRGVNTLRILPSHPAFKGSPPLAPPHIQGSIKVLTFFNP